MLQPIFGVFKVVIGVVHLLPLPGSPGWQGDFNKVLARARSDAEALASGGVDGIIVENFGDVPFEKDRVGPETVASLALAVSDVQRVVKLPLGINVLRNDPLAALAVACVTGARFIRVNVHTGAMVTDQGIIEGRSAETLRYRRVLAVGVEIFADVLVKHGVPLGNQSLGDTARATVERGRADALIITGPFTGEAADHDDVAAVREVVPGIPILVGSGITEANVNEYLAHADGVIVGTSIKVGGIVDNPVDPDRVARLMKRVRGFGQPGPKDL
ncbi:MAG: BtpA/SgcQ family protein [Dehalococcoidia bacterium]